MVWEKEGNFNVKIEENFVGSKIGSLEKLLESQLSCITETSAGHYICLCSHTQNTFVLLYYSLFPKTVANPLKIHRINKMRDSYKKIVKSTECIFFL